MLDLRKGGGGQSPAQQLARLQTGRRRAELRRRIHCSTSPRAPSCPVRRTACSYGFVRYGSVGEAHAAISTLDGTSVLGHTLQVKFADADAGAQLTLIRGGAERGLRHFVASAFQRCDRHRALCCLPPPPIGRCAGPPTIPAPSGLSPSDSCYVKHLPSSYGVRDTD